MDQLIQLLIAIVVFAILGYGLWWICMKFFPNFPPALWVCGLILLIVILYFVSKVVGGGGIQLWPLHRGG